MSIQTFLWTTLAMVAFAANSILCRLALRDQVIDAGSFTQIRLASGAVALVAIVSFRKVAWAQINRQSLKAAAMLVLYAAAFSLSYESLPAAVGALVLFGSVQITMVTVGFLRGERLMGLQVFGYAAAISGFLVLLWPGISAPSLLGCLFMAAAGTGWGFYSLFGQGSADPTSTTTCNFVLATLMMLPLWLLNYQDWNITSAGMVIAVISGAITSGLGYVVWYVAVKRLETMHAAVVQLSVPVIAALGGVFLLNESIQMRLIFASLLVLGGIAVVTGNKFR